MVGLLGKWESVPYSENIDDRRSELQLSNFFPNDNASFGLPTHTKSGFTRAITGGAPIQGNIANVMLSLQKAGVPPDLSLNILGRTLGIDSVGAQSPGLAQLLGMMNPQGQQMSDESQYPMMAGQQYAANLPSGIDMNAMRKLEELRRQLGVQANTSGGRDTDAALKAIEEALRYAPK